MRIAGGMKKYLTDQQLSPEEENPSSENKSQAKEQRRLEIQNDADDIYIAPSGIEARQRLKAFVEKRQNLEEKAVEIFQQDIELTLTFYQFEAELHTRIRTSNLLKRHG